MTDPYAPIAGACPTCGLCNVWFCSDRNCPKGPDQKAIRDRWVESSKNPEPVGGDEGVSKPVPGVYTPPVT